MNDSKIIIFSDWTPDSFDSLTKNYMQKRDLEKFSGSLEKFQNKSLKLHSKILHSLKTKLFSLIPEHKHEIYSGIYEFYFDELVYYYAENIQTATEENILDFCFYRGLRKIPLDPSDKLEILPALRFLYKVLVKNSLVDPFLTDFVDYLSSFKIFYKSHAFGSSGQSFFWDVNQDWLSSYYSFLDDHYLLFDTSPNSLPSREYVGLLENDFNRYLEKLVFLHRRSWLIDRNLTNKAFDSLNNREKDFFRYKMISFMFKWYSTPLTALEGLTPEQVIILERKFFDEKSIDEDDPDEPYLNNLFDNNQD